MPAIPRTRVGAYAVVTDGTRVLLTELALGPSAGKWSLPGGGIEHGESPEAALTRELLEETGVAIDSPALLEVFTSRTTWKRDDGSPDEDVHYIGIVYRARLRGDATLKVGGDGGSCSGARWFERNEIASVVISDHTRHALTTAGL